MIYEALGGQVHFKAVVISKLDWFATLWRRLKIIFLFKVQNWMVEGDFSWFINYLVDMVVWEGVGLFSCVLCDATTVCVFEFQETVLGKWWMTIHYFISKSYSTTWLLLRVYREKSRSWFRVQPAPFFLLRLFFSLYRLLKNKIYFAISQKIEMFLIIATVSLHGHMWLSRQMPT